MDSGMTFLCLGYLQSPGRAPATLDLFTPRPRASVTGDNGIEIDCNYPPTQCSQQREEGSANPWLLDKAVMVLYVRYEIKNIHKYTTWYKNKAGVTLNSLM